MSIEWWIAFWALFLGASLGLYAVVALVVSIRAGAEARRLLAGSSTAAPRSREAADG